MTFSSSPDTWLKNQFELFGNANDSMLIFCKTFIHCCLLCIENSYESSDFIILFDNAKFDLHNMYLELQGMKTKTVNTLCMQ